MNKKTTNRIFMVLILGAILIAVAPYFLTRSFGVIDFSETGQIGDTIGGITAPIASLLGSVLVFFALKAQIDANKIIQDQIDEQKYQEIKRKKIQYLSGQINFVLKEFEEFSYRERQTGSDNQYIEHKGSAAITNFVIRELAWVGEGKKNEDILKEKPKIKHFYFMMSSYSDLIKMISNEAIESEDRKYFLRQLAYIFEAKILPGFESRRVQRAQEEPVCEKCGKKHSGVPSIIFHLVEEIKDDLKEYLIVT